MKDLDTRHRFVELRVKGLSFDRIAQELGTAKQTLLTWDRQMGREIAHCRDAEWRGLLQQFQTAKAGRIQLLSEILQRLTQEFRERDLACVRTDALAAVILKCADSLRDETERAGQPIQPHRLQVNADAEDGQELTESEIQEELKKLRQEKRRIHETLWPLTPLAELQAELQEITEDRDFLLECIANSEKSPKLHQILTTTLVGEGPEKSLESKVP